MEAEAVGPALAAELQARKERREALAPRMLAVERHSHKTFEACVKAAGLSDMPKAFLKKAWKDSAKFKGLTELRAADIGATLNEAIARMALRILELSPGATANQLPTMLKSALMASDQFGGSSVAYSELQLVIEPPKGAK